MCRQATDFPCDHIIKSNQLNKTCLFMSWRCFYANTYPICDPSELQVQSSTRSWGPTVKKVYIKRQLLAVKSWQPRWHLRSGRGNGRWEPGEEAGKIQRYLLSPIASPGHVKFTNTNFELLLFCVKITHRKKWVYCKFLLYIWFRHAYVHSNLVQLILPAIPSVFHSLQTTG